MGNFGILVRDYTLLMSVVPFMVAFCCAYKSNPENIPFFFINSILILSGILCIHMFANLFDDYIDIKKQLAKGLELNQINFRSKRKAKMILNGTFSLSNVKKILMGLVTIAFIIGIYFIFLKGLMILLFMLFAIMLSSFYPISTKYGLGELTVGLVFGPILINAVYYTLTGMFNPAVATISVSIGLITTVLLITQSVMEYDFDKSDGKRTLPVLSGSQKNGVYSILFIILTAYTVLIINNLYFKLNILFYLPVVLTIPISYTLIKSLIKFVSNEECNFIPKFYYGQMENWETIVKNDFAFFMFRFYLARNLSVIFNIVLAFICLFSFPALSGNLN